RMKELEQILNPTPEPEADGEAKAAARALSVLVIDDDQIVNELICEFLTVEGYRVESAFDGLQAMRMFRPAEHDVVMTDVAMPLMNGWELIAALRVRAPELPVVLITGYGSGNWNESYLQKQGVAAVLSKPLDLARMTGILEEIARTKKQPAAPRRR
ncbi:MAG: response regulator, partial [Pyrinomonadaceae bacterium]